MELFSLENNIPIPSAVARTIEPFKSILYPKEDAPRGKGRPPRKNLSGLTALAYVYYMEDFKSPYVQNYGEIERADKVRLRLDIVEEWEEDKFVTEARRVYREDQQTPSGKALLEMKEGLYSMVAMMKAMRKRVAVITSKEELTDAEMREGMNIVEKVFVASEKLPGAIKGIEELQDNVQKMHSGENKGKKRNARE